MSINFLRNFTLLTAFLIIKAANCFAWMGYDYVNGSEIEIGAGNLVREGEVIKFYDWNKEEDHNAEVRLVEYFFGNTKIEVYDYVEQKVKVFDMEN